MGELDKVGRFSTLPKWPERGATALRRLRLSCRTTFPFGLNAQAGTKCAKGVGFARVCVWSGAQLSSCFSRRAGNWPPWDGRDRVSSRPIPRKRQGDQRQTWAWAEGRRVRARVEHTFARMTNWKILRDCRQRGTPLTRENVMRTFIILLVSALAITVLAGTGPGAAVNNGQEGVTCEPPAIRTCCRGRPCAGVSGCGRRGVPAFGAGSALLVAFLLVSEPAARSLGDSAGEIASDRAGPLEGLAAKADGGTDAL